MIRTSIPTGGFADTTPAGSVVPASLYEVEVVKATEQTVKEGSKKEGELYLRLELRPTDPDLADERFFSNLNFWPESKRFLMRDLLALGFTEDELGDPNFEVDPESLSGRRCVAQVGIRTWEGEERNEVRRLMPADDSETAGLPS